MPGLNLLSSATSPATFSTSSPKFGTHFLSAGVAFGSRNCVPNYPMTASCWVRRSSTGGNTARVAFGKNSSFWIGSLGDNAAAAHGSTSGGFMYSSINISDGNWHHLAIVLTSTSGTLFVDGVVGAVSTATPDASNFTLYTSGGNAQSSNRIGIRAFGDGASAFDGSVDDCALFNAAIYTTGTVGITSFTPPSTATAANAPNAIAVFPLDNSLDNICTNRTAVPLNDPNIVYSPYNWAVRTSGLAKTTYPGAYLRFWFTGSTAVLNFDMTGLNEQYSQVRWRMDNGDWTYQKNAAQIVCAAADNFNDSISHFLEFELSANSQTQNWWSPPTVGIQLTSITLDQGRALIPTTRKPGNVVFFSDSIGTVGTFAFRGISSVTGSSNFGDPTTSAAGLSYCYLLGVASGKEFGTIGTPGTGVLFPSTPSGSMALPNMAGSFNLQYSGVPRDFTEYPCDLVVIAHGQNDNGVSVQNMVDLLNTMMSTPGLNQCKFLILTPLNPAKSAIRDRWLQAIPLTNNPSRILSKVCDTFMDNNKTYDGVHPYSNFHKEGAFPNIVGDFEAALRTTVETPDSPKFKPGFFSKGL